MFTHLHHDTPLDDHYERDLYYDGVRRIAEHIHYDLALYPFNDSWDELEYAWGPDYVDELAFAIRDDGVAQYPIQDANYNLVGWFKAIGAVLSQYTYGPYGDLRAAEVRPNHDFPPHAIGHQGLFFVRLDGDPADPPLEVGAKGLYYNRNRWYSPGLGRFMQRDVNETALPILTAYAFNGAALDSLLSGFDGQALYADGMSLYVYLNGNPLNGLDPEGLSAMIWLAETFLAATGGDDSWLDDTDRVEQISFGFGLAGAACLGGAMIVAATPAIVSALQSFQMYAATSGSVCC